MQKAVYFAIGIDAKFSKIGWKGGEEVRKLLYLGKCVDTGSWIFLVEFFKIENRMDKDILEQIEKAKETNILKLDSILITDEDWANITQLTNLRVLLLDEIKNTSIPKDLSKLIFLDILSFSGKELIEFSSFLPNLTQLFISSKKITNFSFLKDTPNLKHLSLESCNLDKIPKEIFALSKLNTLTLKFNKISIIPNEILKLDNLTELELFDNQITEIPFEIGHMTKLVFPDIEKNPLNVLQFGYLLSKEMLKKEKEIFNLFTNIDGLLESNKNFICVKNDKNYYFVELISNIVSLNTLIPNLKEERSRKGGGIRIHVFGDTETQIKVLNDARKIIEQWIDKNKIKYVTLVSKKEEENQEEICTRFFYYPPNSAQKEKTTFIDFENLLEHKSLEENVYFIENKGMKIPVDDLLKYIGAENEKPRTEWNGAPSITKIEIKDFKGFSKIECSLEKNINILIGRNGLGKTSFLQALTLGLLPISNIDKSNEFENHISIGKTKSDILLHWEKEYRKVYVFRNELRHERYLDIPQKLVLAYGTNLNTDSKLDHTRIVEQLINGNALTYSTKSIFKDYSTDFFDPIVLLGELFREKRDKENKLIDSIISLIKNTLNNYLSLFLKSEKISLEGEGSNYYYLDFNKNKLKTNNLSEGYKDFILQITDIIVRIIAARNTIFEDQKIEISNDLFSKAKGVIIIDEFDRHLHPNLQRKFLSQLETDFKNIQFVLSTHNILSLQSGEGHTALILNTDNGGLNIKTEPIQKGLSIESIYNEYFGGDSAFYGGKTEALLEQFQKLLIKQKDKKLTKAESEKFKTTVKELLEYNADIEGIVTREIRQFERLTGKVVEYE